MELGGDKTAIAMAVLSQFCADHRHKDTRPEAGLEAAAVLTLSAHQAASTAVQRWTVDLAGRHQVTGVLYVTPRDIADAKQDTVILVGSDALSLDASAAVPCRHLTEPFLLTWRARYYACQLPAEGRFVHVVRAAGQPVILSELMVFAHRLH